jgi:hypothetical protein
MAEPYRKKLIEVAPRLARSTSSCRFVLTLVEAGNGGPVRLRSADASDRWDELVARGTAHE